LVAFVDTLYLAKMRPKATTVWRSNRSYVRARSHFLFFNFATTCLRLCYAYWCSTQTQLYFNRINQ